MTTPVENGPPSAVAQPGQPAGSGVAVGSAGSGAASLRPELLVGTAITLGLTWIGALALYLTTDDRPELYVGELLLQQGALLVLLVGPVALLVSQREYDLSAWGTVAVGVYVYTELADSGVGVGLLACAGVGLVVGAVIGVIRVLTDAPSVLVTLAGGLLLQGAAYRALTDGDVSQLGFSSLEEGHLGGAGWIVGIALVVLILAILASLLPDDGAAGERPERGPGLAVVVGFALSGMAGVLYGGLALGSPILGNRSLNVGSNAVWMVFTAVAVGGVVAGSRSFGPMAAAVAAPAVVMLADVPLLREWDGAFMDQWFMLGGVFLACLVVAHAARRLVGTPAVRYPVAPGGPAPGFGTPPPGPPSSSPTGHPEPGPTLPPAPPPPPPVPEGS